MIRRAAAEHLYIRLALNIAYAAGNCVVGFYAHSWWFITVGAYYSVLATTRFSVLQIQRKSKGDLESQLFAKRITGILLIVMSVCIVGVIILSALKERGTVLHEIVMIAVAAYTFTKVSVAIVRMIKASRKALPLVITLRNISLADACVSIYTMQRSMLVTFAGMAETTIKLFNILTGTAVCLTVLFLGINLIGGKTMAESKIAKTIENISETACDAYKKVENAVVGNYEKIEQGVVETYTKIEDKFVEAYLSKDGESLEDAKARLKTKIK